MAAARKCTKTHLSDEIDQDWLDTLSGIIKVEVYEAKAQLEQDQKNELAFWAAQRHENGAGPWKSSESRAHYDRLVRIAASIEDYLHRMSAIVSLLDGDGEFIPVDIDRYNELTGEDL